MKRMAMMAEKFGHIGIIVGSPGLSSFDFRDSENSAESGRLPQVESWRRAFASQSVLVLGRRAIERRDSQHPMNDTGNDEYPDDNERQIAADGQQQNQ